MNSKLYPAIEQLLPHSAPMVLLDRVVEHTNTSITCEVIINESSFLFDDELNGVPGQVGIEYMAQSVAALGGIEASADGEKPPIGFLLGARRYQHNSGCFTKGKRYRICATELIRDENMAVYQCVICDEAEETIASGQVNTVIASDSMLSAMNNNE
ncbi:ApeP family dehydratase [Vibrio sp. RC27]